MGAIIPAKILGLEGQVIKDVVFNEKSGRVPTRTSPSTRSDRQLCSPRKVGAGGTPNFAT
jgi:hypothetical protein